MATSNRQQSWVTRLFCGIALLLAAAATGCQVNVGGQTLPSGYLFDGTGDDVQYFAPGPQFQLTNEAAAQGQHRTETPPPPPPVRE